MLEKVNLMNEIERLTSDNDLLLSKKLSQIIQFLGDGRLKNGDETFRAFLKKLPNHILIRYAQECLEKGFQDSGLALQDIVNTIGMRLGYQVSHGLYRGNRAEIGFDGIWNLNAAYSLVIEVKTTDVYRISLDTIANYRNRLVLNGEVKEENSSILIIVGRNDTGELEAQIRGSKHAWVTRIISVDSLIKLLTIKESLSDEKTAQQIALALRPYEYTRVDQLIELLFLTVKDIEIEEIEELSSEESFENKVEPDSKTEARNKPVSFYAPIAERVSAKIKSNLIKKTKSSYESSEGGYGIVLSISKTHPPFNSSFDARYWFAFHPHQKVFLEHYEKKFVCYGCGDESHTFMLPYEFLEPKLKFMWETKNETKEYQHIVIYRSEGKYFLRTTIDEKEHYDDLTEYLI
jgi:hypothetical protein